MKEIETTVRVYINDIYENTCTFYVDIPEDTSKEDEVTIIMNCLKNEVEGEFGDYKEWSEGNISWVLHSWEEINVN